MYEIQVAPKAERQLKKLPKDEASKITKKIRLLEKNPRPDGSTKLSGSTGYYRIRQGNYRVIYEIKDNKLLVLVLVLKVDHRKQIYNK